jgi:collagenase-like PrtC family protease
MSDQIIQNYQRQFINRYGVPPELSHDEIRRIIEEVGVLESSEATDLAIVQTMSAMMGAMLSA